MKKSRVNCCGRGQAIPEVTIISKVKKSGNKSARKSNEAALAEGQSILDFAFGRGKVKAVLLQVAICRTVHQ